jgi:hypothetical protein
MFLHSLNLTLARLYPENGWKKTSLLQHLTPTVFLSKKPSMLQ